MNIKVHKVIYVPICHRYKAILNKKSIAVEIWTDNVTGIDDVFLP